MTKWFPDDENGDVLRRMQENGDDLTKPRLINFTVVLPSQAAANAFDDHFTRTGCRVEIEETGTVPELPWDVVISRNMLPSHGEITAFEAELEAFAESLGGRNDGWGCFAQPTRH